MVEHHGWWKASALAVLVYVALFATQKLKARRARPLPPGPRPLPFVENVLDVPMQNPQDRFSDWAKKFGRLVYISLFGRPMVILNTYEAAVELMERRSAIYSDRPDFIMLTELMGWTHASTHVHYGPRFRKHRRYMQQVFNQHATRDFLPLQRRNALKLVPGLTRRALDEPGNFEHHIRRWAASTILKVAYGKDMHEDNDADRIAMLGEKAGRLTVMSGTTPAAALVDFFPIMKYVPSWLPFAR